MKKDSILEIRHHFGPPAKIMKALEIDDKYYVTVDFSGRFVPYQRQLIFGAKTFVLQKDLSVEKTVSKWEYLDILLKAEFRPLTKPYIPDSILDFQLAVSKQEKLFPFDYYILAEIIKVDPGSFLVEFHKNGVHRIGAIDPSFLSIIQNFIDNLGFAHAENHEGILIVQVD